MEKKEDGGDVKQKKGCFPFLGWCASPRPHVESSASGSVAKCEPFNLGIEKPLLLLNLSDIEAAEFGGALPVGVCTGIFTADELKGASNGGNALILPDLCDTRRFMAMLAVDD
nr:probable receptor-like protein kinase At5g15080 [Ipomoea batatas]